MKVSWKVVWKDSQRLQITCQKLITLHKDILLKALILLWYSFYERSDELL